MIRIRWRVCAGGVCAFVGLAVAASPVAYQFTVSATDGPLAGATATGTFSYSSHSVVPGGSVLTPALTSLSLTWHGIHYTSATANSGALYFDGNGALTWALFGTSCPIGCAVSSGSEGWYVSRMPMIPTVPGNFVYSIQGVNAIGNGTVLLTGPLSPPQPQPPADVPTLNRPWWLALLALILAATADPARVLPLRRRPTR